MPEEENILYFGFDETNHAGPNKKGEIVVCTYSSDHEDSLVKNWPNRRDSNLASKWLEQKGHNYRFTILTGEKYKYQSSATNLTEAASNLILPILTEPNSDIPNTNKLKLYFDGGGFKREQKESLRDHFGRLGLEVVIDNFIKKNKNVRGKTRKGPNCPKLVYLADILASHLDQLTAGELLSHPKFIP
jgi:hypothetical protein